MNAFEEEQSDLVPMKELDLFYTPPTEGIVQKKQWIQYRPTAQITQGSPLEFLIPGTGSQYTDLKHTYLSLIVRILKEDGSTCPLLEKVGPVNIPLHSLFNQVELFLNQTLASSTGVNYAYKAIIDTLLNATAETVDSSLQADGFWKDFNGFMDEDDPLEGANSGLTRRFVLMHDSKLAELRALCIWIWSTRIGIPSME